MPELVVGQAGKELTHNQALAVLDQLAQAVVVDKDLATPPGSPANGAMYIVAAAATGAWAGQSGKLAYWLTTIAAWTFITPADGWSVWVTDEAVRYERKDGAWAEQAGGGTGITNPMTTAGDIIVGGASGAPERLAAGTDGQVLTVVSGEPEWATPAGGGSSARTTQETLPQLLEDSSHSDNLGDFATGVNEFSLVFQGAAYHLFYDDLTGTAYRTAATLAGLAAATPTTLFTGERYPSALHDGSTWHLFTNVSNTVKAHYTSASPGSGYSLADSMPGFPTNTNDVDVQFNPADGNYYCGYKNMGSTRPCGVARAASLSGPWTDLGAVFTNRGTWHAQEEADASCVFLGDRAYVMFAGWDGATQRLGIVEIDPVTTKALGPAFCILEPFEDWHKPVGGRQRIFNPVYFYDGEHRVAYAVNAGSGAAGWGTITPRFAKNPRNQPKPLIFGFNTGTRSDDATGIDMTPHGSYGSYPDRAVFTASTGGFYGNSAFTALNDFTLAVNLSFSNVASGDYQRVCSFETASSSGHTLGLWLNSAGKVYVELKAVYGDPGNFAGAGATTLVANAAYKIVVRRQGNKLRVYLNGVLEITATCANVPTGLSGFRVANAKSASEPAEQQFQGTIYRMDLFQEALPSRQW